LQTRTDSEVNWFGEQNTATNRQTFTVPLVDTQLDSFTHTVRNKVRSSPRTLRST